MSKFKTLNLDADTHEQLKKVAEKEGRTMAGLVRRLIYEYLANTKG